MGAGEIYRETEKTLKDVGKDKKAFLEETEIGAEIIASLNMAFKMKYGPEIRITAPAGNIELYDNSGYTIRQLLKESKIPLVAGTFDNVIDVTDLKTLERLAVTVASRKTMEQYKADHKYTTFRFDLPSNELQETLAKLVSPEILEQMNQTYQTQLATAREKFGLARLEQQANIAAADDEQIRINTRIAELLGEAFGAEFVPFNQEYHEKEAVFYTANSEVYMANSEALASTESWKAMPSTGTTSSLGAYEDGEIPAADCLSILMTEEAKRTLIEIVASKRAKEQYPLENADTPKASLNKLLQKGLTPDIKDTLSHELGLPPLRELGDEGAAASR